MEEALTHTASCMLQVVAIPAGGEPGLLADHILATVSEPEAERPRLAELAGVQGATVTRHTALGAPRGSAVQHMQVLGIPELVLGLGDSQDVPQEPCAVRRTDTSNVHTPALPPVPDPERMPSSSCQHPTQHQVLETTDLSSHPS